MNSKKTTEGTEVTEKALGTALGSFAFPVRALLISVASLFVQFLFPQCHASYPEFRYDGNEFRQFSVTSVSSVVLL